MHDLNANLSFNISQQFHTTPMPRTSNILVHDFCCVHAGPGCSSLGYGAMEEIGPFRVNNDRKTLFRNDYAWNNGNY